MAVCEYVREGRACQPKAYRVLVIFSWAFNSVPLSADHGWVTQTCSNCSEELRHLLRLGISQGLPGSDHPVVVSRWRGQQGRTKMNPAALSQRDITQPRTRPHAFGAVILYNGPRNPILTIKAPVLRENEGSQRSLARHSSQPGSLAALLTKTTPAWCLRNGGPKVQQIRNIERVLPWLWVL